MQPTGRGDQLIAAGIDLRFGQPLRGDAGQRRDLRDRPPLQLGRLGIKPQLAGDPKEPAMEPSIYAGCDFPDPKLADDQVIGRRTHAAGDDQPRHQPPVMTPDRQLLIECHRRPAVRPDAQKERARRRGDFVLREHPSSLEIGAVGADQRLDVGVALQAAHDASSPASGSSCASIASAAARYSLASQSFARCR
jgi:hypothetical protein